MLYSKETNYDPTFGGLRKGVWIGLSGYKKAEGDIKWKWADDFPVMFTRWGINQPNFDDINIEPSKSCVYIDKGKKTYYIRPTVNAFLAKWASEKPKMAEIGSNDSRHILGNVLVR